MKYGCASRLVAKKIIGWRKRSRDLQKQVHVWRLLAGFDVGQLAHADAELAGELGERDAV